ncbi:MAG: YqhA family protein [Anaerolineae bacterium]|nr:YqhA family protein [Anaerolineae bacterium]MCB0232614.1 YqhA family protein [Anaerolineae bacterium]
MQRILTGTRYLIIIPVIGLVLASAIFFVFGGIGLIRMLLELVHTAIEILAGDMPPLDRNLLIVEVVEYVHTFLVGTVLFITAVGLYQLFITDVKFPGWLRIDSTEDLETNLIGVTVVVLAVNFMSRVFLGTPDTVLQYGAGIALPIAALGIFLGLRAWGTKMVKDSHHRRTDVHHEHSDQHHNHGEQAQDSAQL